MNRDKAIEAVKELPQEFNLEELMEKLVFMEKVQMGLNQLEAGNVKTHEQVKNIVKEWQK